jgi:hypothetical protein
MAAALKTAPTVKRRNRVMPLATAPSKAEVVRAEAKDVADEISIF